MKTTTKDLICKIKDSSSESYQLFNDSIEFAKIKAAFQETKNVVHSEEFESFMLDNYIDNLAKYKSAKKSGYAWYLIYKKGNIVSIHDFFFFKHRTNYERIINLPDSDYVPYPTHDFLKKAAIDFFKCNHESLYDKRCSGLSYKPNVGKLMDEVTATAADTEN